jgi:hypothetical protein
MNQSGALAPVYVLTVLVVRPLPGGRSGRDVAPDDPATSEGNQAPTTRARASAEPTTRS